MQNCPHCNLEIRINELPHPGLFANYRVCPGCSGRFTVDQDTRYRQAACLIIALISLAYTLAWYYLDVIWLWPALASYAALGGLIYWGNRQLFFVPYNE